jgi:hypothetical protein
MNARNQGPAKLKALALLALLLAAAALLATSLGSCSPRLGWGLILWAAPEGPLPAGAIVPVYIKSNIQKVYVVGVPGLKGKDRNKKIELPFWQVELYPSYRAAAAKVKAMGANMSLYMIATRDGLPLRDKPSNGAKRVYRLREGQSVKVLEKAEGDAVTTGNQVLPGSWYLVLTDDGSKGYAFSYALRLYDEAKEGPPVLASAKQALSGRVDLIFSRSWRPEYFQEMLDDAHIDLDYFSLRYGVFSDTVRRQIRIELPAASEVFNYTDISEASGFYIFEGTPLKVKIESDTRMTCYWSGQDPTAVVEQSPATDTGTPATGDAQAAPAAEAQAQDTAVEGYKSAGVGGSAAFVVPGADPLEAMRLEVLRRQKLLVSFVDEIGGVWRPAKTGAESASASGKLEIAKNGRFTWKAREGAAAALLPAETGESGDIAFRLFLDPSLNSTWNGAFSIRFDQDDSGRGPQKWLDFLYRRSPVGLVLAPATLQPASLVVMAADSRIEPLILETAAE